MALGQDAHFLKQLGNKPRHRGFAGPRIALEYHMVHMGIGHKPGFRPVLADLEHGIHLIHQLLHIIQADHLVQLPENIGVRRTGLQEFIAEGDAVIRRLDGRFILAENHADLAGSPYTLQRIPRYTANAHVHSPIIPNLSKDNYIHRADCPMPHTGGRDWKAEPEGNIAFIVHNSPLKKKRKEQHKKNTP
ncbi:hypothetical protein D3C75_856250 [compost metagenome]